MTCTANIWVLLDTANGYHFALIRKLIFRSKIEEKGSKKSICTIRMNLLYIIISYLFIISPLIYLLSQLNRCNCSNLFL